jgi:glycosyltransferase involved in cell wall biosynthesis
VRSKASSLTHVLTPDLAQPGVEALPISVVVPTRERPTDVHRALDALLRSDHPHFEILIVVDPEESGTTSDSVGHMLRASGHNWHPVATAEPETIYRCDSGVVVRHLRSPRRGVSAARNAGALKASGALLAFTDDDCTAPTDWLGRLEGIFAEPNPPGLVSGALVAAPHDLGLAHIPEFRPPASTRLVRRSVRPWSLGVSANMAVRRSTFIRLGGFDARLGPGTPQRGEDTHFAYRVLQAGLSIQVDASNGVTHWGARPIAGGCYERLLRSNWFGVGACYGLLFADGDYMAAVVFGREVRSSAAGTLLGLLPGSNRSDPVLLPTALKGFMRGVQLSRAHRGRR